MAGSAYMFPAHEMERGRKLLSNPKEEFMTLKIHT
jgi:hypothetical protein